MSTEIKNTLFRFVTMRAPELTDEDGMNIRFINRKERVSGNEIRIFEDAITAGIPGSLSKWQLMVNRAATYTPKTPAELKTLNKDICEFGIWLTRNKINYVNSEVVSKANSQTALTTDTVNLLWDNLFYQVVMQKDYYAKETIMQMLLANHLVESKSLLANAALCKKYINAKVVLPKSMFVENDGSTPGSFAKTLGTGTAIANTKAYRSEPSAEMRKLRENEAAIQTTALYNSIGSELKKAEKKHKMLREAAYSAALEEHEASVKLLMDAYYTASETAKDSWCSLHGPDWIYDPKDPCNQPPTVKYPELPVLNFAYTKEMDFEFLAENMGTETFDGLLELLKIDFTPDSQGKADPYTITDIDGNGLTFDHTQELLDAAIANQTAVIVNNMPSQNTTVVSVGGVIVPTTSQNVAAPFTFQICPAPHDQTHLRFDIAITVPDSSWVIDAASHYKITGDAIGTQALQFVSRNGNHLMLRTQETHAMSLYQTVTEFEAAILFTNGQTKNVTIPNTVSESFYRSCYSSQMANGEGTTGGDAATQNFTPSGFGFRQIGIADYKRVEQTTQGYVEGDVAHIENIMAREYKEKATRKLRRSENTTTLTNESEKEKLTDTTSTDRYELHSEIAKVMQEDRDMAANAGMSYTPNAGNLRLETSLSMASHSSNQTSTLNAVNQAKELTERALDRIVTKVKEERIEKIIEEFEESNKHGFDNTKGDKHVVGVFRWVDKVFKNQVYNYGKRLMFEFMVPQPSKLHLLGMTENKAATVLTAPIDPRKYEDAPNIPANSKRNLSDYLLINDTTVKYWGGVLNVELKPCPELQIKVGNSFAQNKNRVDEGFTDSKTDSIKIPEGYISQSVSLYLNNASEFGPANGLGTGRQNIAIPGNYLYNHVDRRENISIPGYKDELPVAYFSKALHAASASVELVCVLSREAKEKWQMETFKAIIDAYEDALAEYNQKLAEEKALGMKIKDENPGFYRQIENLILRKNCISYLINQETTAAHTYGRDMFKPLVPAGGLRTLGNHEVNVSAALDDYTSFAKFLEQAFEWEIMSYNFYPYYWGKREDWGQLYQYENNDPLFRNFMQAGMARVVITVRPGFEEAVRYYMQTGRVWNGGEVPVIEDKLFLSLVDELRAPKGVKEGKAWATRLPTALTILQAKNIGLNVSLPLPYDSNLNDYENPAEVPVSTELTAEETLLGNGDKPARLMGRIFGNFNFTPKVVLKKNDGSLFDLTYTDKDGNWELGGIPAGTYELNLDANDQIGAGGFLITDGQIIQPVTLAADQAMEVNLSVS